MTKTKPAYASVVKAAEKYGAIFGVPVPVILSIISVESGFRPNLSNRSERAMKRGGAWGLGQVTLDTAKDLTNRFASLAKQHWPRFDGTGESLFDIDTNVAIAAFYLARSWKRYKGDFYATTLSYHQGVSTVDKLIADPRPWSEKLPPYGRIYFAELVKAQPKYKAYV